MLKKKILSGFVVVVSLLAACVSADAPAQKETPFDYPDEGVTLSHDSPALAADSVAGRALASFHRRAPRYFAAFAVSDTGLHGEDHGQHNRAEAVASALDLCRAAGGGATCRVVVERVPPGYKEGAGLTLSQNAGKAWRRYLTKPGPKAFALGSGGAYASHFSGQPLDTARRLALRACQDPLESGTSLPKNCRIIASED